MDRWLRRMARLVGASIGAFAGLVAIQFLRLQRMEFLPKHPGFYVHHVVTPASGVDGVHGTAATGAVRLRMVVLGDSTTAGVGVDRAEDSLPYLLAQRIADARRSEVQVTSYGWAGARVADLVRQQLPRALEPIRAGATEPYLSGADIVVVVIGANDATHRTPPWRYRADLRSVLSGIREAAPGADVVLAGIPTFRGALRSAEPLIFLTDQYARVLRPISRAEAVHAGTAFADLARDVPPRLGRRPDALSGDRFHPSAIGYAAWAEVIAEALLAPREAAAPAADARIEPAGA